MPIELLYTDSEILKIKLNLLKKDILDSEELKLLREINIYISKH